MEQVFEFVGNHLLLVTALVVLLAAFVFTENKRGGQSVSTHEATKLINREKAVVLDLRAQSEFNNGHIVDALNVPYTSLSTRLAELEKYKDRPIILVCKMGQHSGAAA
ncbi:MAG: rhodanese-like domain-containing protein, partial [Pseudomonadales bacterium]|nr:rhodanese-like domain-containing protein [Pseudomonadales bacterium]